MTPANIAAIAALVLVPVLFLLIVEVTDILNR